jgi:ABC-type transport system substrate-binding protein
MFLSGIIGLVFWIRFKNWLSNYKYRYRLLLKISVQLTIVGLISIASTLALLPQVPVPKTYGDSAMFIPLSFPLFLKWSISGDFLIPVYHHYSISVFNSDILVESSFEFASEATIRTQIFQNCIPIFLGFNVIFLFILILVYESWMIRKKKHGYITYRYYLLTNHPIMLKLNNSLASIIRRLPSIKIKNKFKSVSFFLLIAVIVSLISNIVLFINSTQIEESPTEFSMFRRVIGVGPNTIEPLDSMDFMSRDVIHQVCEGLFAYDLRDISLPRINHLAEDYFWINQSILQIKVREGVLFHDGYPFNASAVKWNLERINYLINATGTLPSNSTRAKSASLFFFPDGITPIINRTILETEFNVTIYLNSPYSPFLNLLCHQACSILSPYSNPATSLIQLDEDLIGTGPFIFDSCTQHVEVHFSRWEGYWRNLAHFEKMIFGTYEYFECSYAKGCEMDWYNSEYFSPWRELGPPDDTIKIINFTDDTGFPSLTYQYLGFNNQVYNATWRKVMCLALNYSYVLENFRTGNGIRANSPISSCFGAAYNLSAQTSYNITQARNIMQSMGFGLGFVNDSQWRAVAEGVSPFLTVNFTFNNGNTFREDLFFVVQEWYKDIGVKVEENGVTWSQYLSYLNDTPEYLSLYSHYSTLEHFDPYNMLNQLFNPNSDSNIAQVDDPWVNNKLSLALNTSDETTRNNIYKDIQWYLTEIGYFHAPLYHPKTWFTHSTNIYNAPYNALDLFEAYYIYRVD